MHGVNIHRSYDNKEHEHICRLQKKKQKNKHCTMLFEIHVSQSIEFCHWTNSFLLRNCNFKILFLWLPIDLLFSHSKKKKLSRELCGGIQWLFQKHAVPPLWQFITTVFLIDCFSLFWYREKTVNLYDIHQIGHRQLI